MVVVVNGNSELLLSQGFMYLASLANALVL